jgi:hypothetical protein
VQCVRRRPFRASLQLLERHPVAVTLIHYLMVSNMAELAEPIRLSKLGMQSIHESNGFLWWFNY